MDRGADDANGASIIHDPGSVPRRSVGAIPLCAENDKRVRDFLARPIEGDWPYLWLDAT